MSYITATLDSLPFETASPDGYTLTIGDNGLKGWFDGPPVIRPGTRRLWAHGRFSERGWRDARIITVEGLVLANDTTAMKKAYQAVTGIIADGTAGLFTVNDPMIGNQHCNVYLAAEPKFEWETDLTAAYMFQLEATDPLKYGDEISAFTLPLEIGGGLGFDLFTQNTLGIMDFGAIGQAGTCTLHNEGTAFIYPRFEITGQFLNFELTETGSGARLVYAGSVADGQTLLMDSRTGTATVSGANRATNLTTREWTAIAPGETVTYLFDPGTYGVNAGMTVRAAPAWF